MHLSSYSMYTLVEKMWYCYQASEEVRRLKSVGSEVDVIKSQQEEFASFRKQVVEPIGKGVDEVNRLGSGLIQSAAGGVNTSAMEKDLEKVNDKWNALKDKVSCGRVKCTKRLSEYLTVEFYISSVVLVMLYTTTPSLSQFFLIV